MKEEQKNEEYDEWGPVPDRPEQTGALPLTANTQNGGRVLSEFVIGRQKIYGENTMLHGSFVLPKEYGRFLWACNVTPRQYSVLITLMMANNLDNEMEHKPTYISQKEVGAQLGVTGSAISKTYQRLEDKNFECPFDCDFALKGYIRREKVPFKDGELQSDHVWTDGFKDIINHLAGHYNEYMAEFGYEGQKKFKQARDVIIANNVKEWRKERGRYALEHRDDGDY